MSYVFKISLQKQMSHNKHNENFEPVEGHFE